ncbi:MAG: Transporter MgtC/SapB family [Thermacetogenium phaeum]|uniref:Transporter MgtC/SapB family n=1 Tax=Thermacetogenium phaeum TaxID=85874 RepID=A0A117LBK9_9THEO|nr:MAG: Transporter MgtC/SapB family [Thermacetogenium phaeum]
MLSNQEILIRMLVSLLVGLIIGYERSWNQKPAGVRTYSLVCIGSTLFMIISAYGLPGTSSHVIGFRLDPGRIAAQIVTGIGFLGAGVIWKDRGTIRGLTTAANLWVSAGLGMAIGAGMYFLTLVSVICIFLALYSSPILCRLGLLKYPPDDGGEN